MNCTTAGPVPASLPIGAAILVAASTAATRRIETMATKNRLVDQPTDFAAPDQRAPAGHTLRTTS
jgi:hypothetical protein